MLSRMTHSAYPVHFGMMKKAKLTALTTLALISAMSGSVNCQELPASKEPPTDGRKSDPEMQAIKESLKYRMRQWPRIESCVQKQQANEPTMKREQQGLLSLVASTNPLRTGADMLVEIDEFAKNIDRYENASGSVTEGSSRLLFRKLGLMLQIAKEYPFSVSEIFELLNRFSKNGLFDKNKLEVTPVAQDIITCLSRKS